jgi:hypothetical protein
MKKLLLLLLTIMTLSFFAAPLSAQNTQTFDFEDNAIPAGWTNDATHPWVVTSTSQGNGHNGTYCIKSGNSGIGSSTSTLSATFTFAGEGSISFLAGIWGEGTTTVWDKCIFKIDGVEQFSEGAVQTWTTRTFDLEAGTHTFTWSYTKDGSVNPTGDAFYLDDIVVDLGVASSCTRPASITLGTITANTIDITWTPTGDETAWKVYIYDNDGDLLPGYPDDATTTAYSFTNLEAHTPYTIGVKANCTTELSAERIIHALTDCAAFSVSNEPYYEQFEGYAANSFPDCWTKVMGYNTYPKIENSATTAHQGQGYLTTSTTNATPIIMALPPFEEDLSTLRLSFWMKPAGATSSYGRVELGVMTNLADTSSFTLLKSWTAVGIGSANWKYYEINLDTMDIETGYLTFRRFGGASTAYAWYFDDVKVMPIPACEAPTELEFIAATSSSVDLKWNPGENTDFTVYYKPADSDEAYSSAINATLDADSIYTLEGLDPATEYSIYVASVCVDGSENYCDPILGFTTMVPAELPYSTDFSEDADRNWLLNNGSCLNYWVMGEIPDTTVSALYITNNSNHAAQYSLSSAVSMVSAAKLFTIGTAPQAIISFDVMIGGEAAVDYMKLFFAPETETYPAKAGTAPTSSEYGYYSYSTYAFDFSDYMSASYGTTTTAYRYKFNKTNGNVVHIDALMPNPHSNPDENSTAQVVFVWKNDGSAGVQPGAIISNVTVTVPSCHRPENLVATNVTAHSADLSWNGGEATQWVVEYGVHGFTLGQGTTIDVQNDPESSLTQLADNTEYDVYVKAICGDTESPTKTISFTTPCVGLTEVPYTCNFDSVGSGSYVLPDCWNRIISPATTYGYPYSYSSSTYAHSGSRVLYFYNGYYNSYAIMPGIDATELNIQDLQVSFYARSSSASTSASLEVGVMTDPTDTATFTLIQAFHPAASYTSDPIVVPLSNYTGSGNYIAFRNTRTASVTTYYYVDDVKLEVIPNCSKALYLTATPSTHEAELSWMATGSSFDLHYKKASETTYTVEPNVSLEDGAYLLTDLDAATQYSWYIVTNCEDDTTFTSAVATFVTECEGLTSVPQTWGFEDNLTVGTGSYLLPTCWNRIISSSSTTAYPYANTTASYAHTGTHSLYFYYFNAYAIMPPINPEILNMNELQVSFYSRLNAANENIRLVVGVMDDPSDASTFTGVDTIALTTTYGNDPFIVTFDEYDGEGTYIAFKNILLSGSSTTAVFLIDDVTLAEIPSCDAPTGTSYFAAYDFVDISWENMTEGTYNVHYKADTDSVYTSFESVSISDDFYTITDLEPSTTYNFYIATVCDDGSESISEVYTFTTLCSPYPTPFTETFSAGTVPQCWAKAVGLASDAFAGHNPTPTTSGWAFNTLVFGHNHPKVNVYGATVCKYWLISPDIDLSNLSSPALQFNLALTDWNYATPIEDPNNVQDDKFMVIISTDHGATWSEANATIWSSDSNAQYVFNQIPNYGQEIQIPLDEYAGQNIRIAFYVESTVSGGDNDLHIDNVVVGEAITCFAPYAIAVSNVTDATATVSWNGNGGSSWKVEYGLEGFTPGEDGTIVTVTDTFATLSGLTDNTDYEVYVNTICGDESSNSIHTTFHTQCSGVAIPYTEDFEAYATGTTAAFVDCWDRFNTYSTTTNYPYVSSTTSSYAHSGSKYLYFYNSSATYSVAVLPMVDVTINPVNSLQVSFWMRPGALTNKIVVGVMTTSNDFSTFVPVDTIANTAVALEYHEVPLNSYNGNGAFVALRMLNTGSTYTLTIDDVTLEVLPSCPKPTAVTATASTTNSVTLSWTAGGTEEAWEIAYGAPGFNPDSTTATIVSATTNPFTVGGLTSSTNYEFRVRAICTETDHSNWSTAVVGATQCDVTTLPYTEDFEGYVGTTYSDAHGVTPLCWTTYGTSTSYGVPHITSSGSWHWAHSGTNCLSFTCNTAAPNQYAALPTFDQPLNTLKLNFWRRMENVSYGTLTVGYVTNLNDLPGSFVVVDTIPSVATESTADTISVDFTGANIPANGNICFHWYLSGTYYTCCIDDINVTVVGDTTTPITTYTVTLNTADATMGTVSPNTPSTVEAGTSFTATATANDGYHFVAWTSNNATVSTANPYTFTVNADITLTATFEADSTPVEPCDVPTGLHTTAIENHSIAIAWDANANVSSWNIRYRVVNGTWNTATATTNSYTISGLEGLTNYEIQIQANCGNGNLSAWSASVTAQTTNVGIVNHLENSVTLFPNPAKEYVDVRIDDDVNVTLMEVYDVYGKLIRNVNVIDNPTRINVSSLANGMYFVRVTTDAGMVTKTFVKK